MSDLCVSIIYWNSLYYAFSEVFKLCETENLNFAVYFMIDKHSYKQVHLKVEPKSFLIAGIHCRVELLIPFPCHSLAWGRESGKLSGLVLEVEACTLNLRGFFASFNFKW